MKLEESIELCGNFNRDPGTIGCMKDFVIPRLEKELCELNVAIAQVSDYPECSDDVAGLREDAGRIASAIQSFNQRLAA